MRFIQNTVQIKDSLLFIPFTVTKIFFQVLLQLGFYAWRIAGEYCVCWILIRCWLSFLWIKNTIDLVNPLLLKKRRDKITWSESMGKLLLFFEFTGDHGDILKLVTLRLINFLRWTCTIERRCFFFSDYGIHRHRLIDKFLVNLNLFDHFLW